MQKFNSRFVMLAETFKIFFSSWYIYSIFGLIFGSFLNVVIYRVPNGISLIYPPSACPNCGHRIKWYENIPILSWIFLRGKCSSCGKSISLEYPTVELLTGIITTALFFFTGPVLELAIYLALAYALLCIIIIDYKTYSIPHGLNITLLIISVTAVVINTTLKPFLPVGITGSLLGAVTGFGILYLIQKVGRIIYRQEAMGTGDLFLLGSAGLMLGPKLTLVAFILGSIMAVITYTVPSIINLINRKKESVELIRAAEKFESFISEEDPGYADLQGLKMQLFFSINDNRAEEIKKNVLLLADKKSRDPEFLTRLFFRFTAIRDNKNALKMLSLLNSLDETDTSVIEKVIKEDMVGYDSSEDNLNLIMKKSSENSFDFLLKTLSAIKTDQEKEDWTNDISKIKEAADKINDPQKRLEFLLMHNRNFQFEGYTSEQKKITELIISDPDLKDPEFVQRYLSDYIYVYYRDFYFRESRECLEKLDASSIDGRITANAVGSIYNTALFRYVFFRQRLAFGPFLSSGIFISLFWGERIAGIYYEFIEKLII